MSKIALSGNASGTGTFTIASPNGNTDRTLTLPDNTGTLVTQNSQPAFASTIGVGGATPSASGAGITFPATQSASTDANTLDDYEEGTWTPGVGGTATYGLRTGRYTKIGNKVFFEGAFQVAVLGTGSTGDIAGLPFTTNGTDPQGTISVGYWAATAQAFAYVSATLGSNGTSINMRGSTGAANALGALNFFTNGTAIYFSGQYTV